MKLFLLAIVALVACSPTSQTPSQPVSQPSPQPSAPTAMSNQAQTPAPLPDRDPQLARRLVREQGALLLDVRSEAEFSAGHIDGAVLIPHDQVKDRLADIEAKLDGDRSRPIVVYCRSGRRSGLAKDVLLEAGFTQVTNVGGMSDWRE